MVVPIASLPCECQYHHTIALVDEPPFAMIFLDPAIATPNPFGKLTLGESFHGRYLMCLAIKLSLALLSAQFLRHSAVADYLRTNIRDRTQGEYDNRSGHLHHRGELTIVIPMIMPWHFPRLQRCACHVSSSTMVGMGILNKPGRSSFNASHTPNYASDSEVIWLHPGERTIDAL